MKWILLLASFLSFQSIGLCQNSSKIVRFDGGIFDSGIQIGRTPLSDLSFGNFYSHSNYQHWMNISINPAFASTYTRPSIYFQMGPQVQIIPSHFTDVDAKVRSSVDNALVNYKTKNTEISYPKIGTVFQANKMWAEGLACFPVGKWRVALGYQEVLNFSARARLSGAGTGISTLVDMGGGTKSNVLFTAFIGSLLDVDFRIDKTQLTFSKILWRKYGVGLSLERLGGRTQIYGRMNVQGDMVFNGQEYIFDDPNDNWHNSLKQALDGSFSGSAWRLVLGFWRPISRTMIFDFAVRTTAKMDMSGQMNVLQNKIPALNMSALSSDDKNAEIMDPVKLNLSQLTRTEPVQNKTYSTLSLHFPGRLALGLTWKKKKFYWYNNLAFLFGASELSYGPSELSFQETLDVTSVIGIFNFYLNFGATANRIEAKKINFISMDETKAWLPKFSFGYGRVIHENYLVVGKIGFLPAPIFYLTTGFRF